MKLFLSLPARPQPDPSVATRREAPMTDLNASQGQQLRRVLKPRHLNMIAIGGSIGTGLFVASGATVATPGPAVRCFPTH